MATKISITHVSQNVTNAKMDDVYHQITANVLKDSQSKMVHAPVPYVNLNVSTEYAKKTTHVFVILGMRKLMGVVFVNQNAINAKMVAVYHQTNANVLKAIQREMVCVPYLYVNLYVSMGCVEKITYYALVWTATRKLTTLVSRNARNAKMVVAYHRITANVLKATPKVMVFVNPCVKMWRQTSVDV